MSLPGPASDFDAYRTDLEAAERRVAGEIDPGARGFVVAILVFVLLVSFILPHAGAARGIDVLVFDDKAVSVGIGLPSRVFSWMSLVFGVGFSMLALITRRWALAFVALAGSALASATGLLAIWSRQTAKLPNANGITRTIADHPGPGIGLLLAWLTVIILTFHWARVVWTRTAVQLAAEAQRRQEAADEKRTSLRDGLDRPGDRKPR